MTEKTMMGVLVMGELIGVAIVVLASMGHVGANVAIAAGLFMGPVLIVAYHFTFIAPHTIRLAYRNAELERKLKEVLADQGEYKNQLRQSQALLRNLTASKRRQMLPSFVYFVADQECTHVKIGISNDPEKRLSSLQTSNQGKLQLLGVVEGDSKLEQQYHEQFKHLRQSGEWFKAEPELLSFIEQFAKKDWA